MNSTNTSQVPMFTIILAVKVSRSELAACPTAFARRPRIRLLKEVEPVIHIVFPLGSPLCITEGGGTDIDVHAEGVGRDLIVVRYSLP